MRHIPYKRILSLLLLLSCLSLGGSLAEQAPASHAVTFVDWRGNPLHTFTIADGEGIDPNSIEPIEREGYPFLFWFDINAEGELQAFDFATPIERDTVLGPCFGAYTGEPKVVITTTMGSVIAENEPVTLTAELLGFEGKTVSLQWQYNDGSRWRDVRGANGYTHVFEATRETVNYQWRVEVRAR